MNGFIGEVECLVHNSRRYICLCIPNCEFRSVFMAEKADEVSQVLEVLEQADIRGDDPAAVACLRFLQAPPPLTRASRRRKHPFNELKVGSAGRAWPDSRVIPARQGRLRDEMGPLLAACFLSVLDVLHLRITLLWQHET